MTDKDKHEVLWLYALLSDITQEPVEYTPNGILSLIRETLTDRERSIIEKRYHDEMSLNNIGREYGLTTERIRQIQVKALRKMRNPARLLRYSSVPYTKYEEEFERRKAAEEQLNSVLSNSALPTDVLKRESKTPTLELHIEHLCLSTRSYNCLWRKGIKTVKDLLTLENEWDLLTIRNLGAKSADEILNAVHRLGLKMKWEDTV